MHMNTDSKHLKIDLTDIERQLVFKLICQRYGYTPSKQYHYVVRDKRNGVYLLHFPRAPFANYTTSLIFQGYSNESQLLKDIFEIIPLRRWKARRIDIALDTNLPYQQLHAIHPAKRADTTHYRTSVYLGSHSSPVQLHMYDKQEQMYRQWGIMTDTWTRIELRFRFEPMMRISSLCIDDFAAAAHYSIIPEVCAMSSKLKDQVTQLNQGLVQWRDLTRTTQEKIREYGCEHGLNMFEHILSALENTDICSFVYDPKKQPPQQLSS
ncbi:replication initiation factor domain-containing protein [Paenibacillus sp. YYML68]|uniref:replication initiation factor domain-containing protein n=1 Tax=Paenibacillus sp. YYML68 TaxID=2909250 RepID=UPI00249007BB|nr:replication initiation factor domain-containing protein [Paenibacillus sp. YYML68]